MTSRQVGQLGDSLGCTRGVWICRTSTAYLEMLASAGFGRKAAVKWYYQVFDAFGLFAIWRNWLSHVVHFCVSTGWSGCSWSGRHMRC